MRPVSSCGYCPSAFLCKAVWLSRLAPYQPQARNCLYRQYISSFAVGQYSRSRKGMCCPFRDDLRGASSSQLSNTRNAKNRFSPMLFIFLPISIFFLPSYSLFYFYPIYCSTVPIRGKSIGITELQPGTVAWNSTVTEDLPFRASGSRSAPVYPVQLPPFSALTGPLHSLTSLPHKPSSPAK